MGNIGILEGQSLSAGLAEELGDCLMWFSFGRLQVGSDRRKTAIVMKTRKIFLYVLCVVQQLLLTGA